MREGSVLATLTVTGRKRAKRFIWSEELHRWVKIFLEKVDRVRNEVIIDCPDRNIRITFVPGEEWAMVKGTIKGQSRIDPRFGGKIDRKSTRLNSSHMSISYAVFCLKKTGRILVQLFLPFFTLCPPIILSISTSE